MNYGDGIAGYCDLFEPAAGASDAAALVERVAGPRPGTLLDIGAGAGGTAFALAAKGWTVTALEPDPQMHAVMLARLALRKDLEPHLTPVPRAAGFVSGRRFDVCLCLSVLHLILDPGEPRRLLAYAAAQLVPGGRLLLEVPVASARRVDRPLALAAQRRFGDVVFRHWSAQRNLGGDTWCTDRRFDCSCDGEELDARSQSFTWHAFSLREVLAQLIAAGLLPEALHADRDGATFVEGDSRVLVVVARRPFAQN